MSRGTEETQELDDKTEEHEAEAEPAAASRSNLTTWLAAGVLGVAIVVPLVGLGNPWHLVAVDRWLNHPWFGGLVALGAGTVLWYRHVSRQPYRSAGFAVLVAAFLVWPLVGLMLLLVETDGRPLYGTDDAVSTYNDVTAHERSDMGWPTSRITLYADRGWASRRHTVRRLGFLGGGDSGPPDFHMEFTAADELTVHYENEVVYRLTFDPRTLGVRGEECHRITGRDGKVVGCEPRATGFWGWLSDA